MSTHTALTEEGGRLLLLPQVSLKAFLAEVLCFLHLIFVHLNNNYSNIKTLSKETSKQSIKLNPRTMKPTLYKRNIFQFHFLQNTIKLLCELPFNPRVCYRVITSSLCLADF